MNIRTALTSAAVIGTMVVVGGWTVAQMKWNATLAPMSGSTIKGTATMVPGKDAGTATATVSITGGKAGAAYPWHVHVGKCPTGGVFGTGSAYKPISVGKDGSGTSTAELAVASPNGGDYHVNIHASENDMKTLVACGEFNMSM